MKVDGGIGNDLHKAPAQAQELEAAGYSGAWTAETAIGPLLAPTFSGNSSHAG